jgi:recombinational DNA repair ATPase RecF
MFSKVKAWLRSIIAEEVAKVSVSLSKERAESIAFLKNIEEDIIRHISIEATAFECHVNATLEAEHGAFVERLRATRNHISNGEPCRWQADEETVKADHSLKMVK